MQRVMRACPGGSPYDALHGICVSAKYQWIRREDFGILRGEMTQLHSYSLMQTSPAKGSHAMWQCAAGISAMLHDEMPLWLCIHSS